MAKVYNFDGTEMSSKDLAKFANGINLICGGNGLVFSSEDFNQENPKCRLRGHMCDCGTNSKGMSLGEFELENISISYQIKMGKAYMRCKKCGCYSHL